MIKSIEVKLYSNKRHHGASKAKASLSMAGAASKIAKLISQSKAAEKAGEKSQTKITNTTKPYGSHNGTAHVDKMLSFTNEDLYQGGVINETPFKLIANTLTRFEKLDSIDMRAKKSDHMAKKLQINGSYLKQYGSEIKDPSIIKRQADELAAIAFDYVQHSIVVTIKADAPLEGMGNLVVENDESDSEGIFTYRITSKRVYTNSLLSTETRSALKSESNSDQFLKLPLVKAYFNVILVPEYDEDGNIKNIRLERKSKDAS